MRSPASDGPFRLDLLLKREQPQFAKDANVECPADGILIRGAGLDDERESSLHAVAASGQAVATADNRPEEDHSKPEDPGQRSGPLTKDHAESHDMKDQR